MNSRVHNDQSLVYEKTKGKNSGYHCGVKIQFECLFKVDLNK